MLPKSKLRSLRHRRFAELRIGNEAVAIGHLHLWQRPLVELAVRRQNSVQAQDLRRLIAKGDINGVPLAERAIQRYWDETPAKARKSGLRLIQQDVLGQRKAVLGSQRNFADAVTAPVGNRAEMLRIRKEPVPGLLVGQPYQYVDDFDLNGTIDIGSTTGRLRRRRGRPAYGEKPL